MLHYYWEGYAEVLHLVTTARCLPTDPGRALPLTDGPRARPAGRRLLRRVTGLIGRRA